MSGLTSTVTDLADQSLFRSRHTASAPNSGQQAPALSLETAQRDFVGTETDAWIQPPFFCDYGTSIALSTKVFFNFNCVMLDCVKMTIGKNVIIESLTCSPPMNEVVSTARALASAPE